MNAPGRNDPCPCGSGKKYKKCCLDKPGVEKPVAVQHTGGQAAIEQLIQAALAHQHAGRLQEAAELYQQVLQLEPQSADALHLFGLIKHQTGEHQAAIDLISRAIEISPATALYYYSAGLVLAILGQMEVALACYKKALELQPEFAETLNNIGLLLQGQNNFDEAAEQYRAAIAIKPDFAEAHFNLGNVLRAKGVPEEAIFCYQMALQYRSSYPAAQNNLGVVFAEMGRFEEALQSYSLALSQLPGYVDAHNNLGAALEKLGRYEEAREHLQRGLELKPDQANAYCNLGNIERSMGQLDSAINNYQKALSLDPRHAESYNNLGSVLLDLGRHNAAQTLFEKAVELSPAFADAYNNLARVLAENGDYAKCIEYSKKALAFKPDFSGPYINIGFAECHFGRFSESIAAYREALRLNPAHAGIYSNLLLTMLYDSKTLPAEIFTESLKFAEQYESPYRGCWPQHTNAPVTTRRLKVGYVSADFRAHALAYFIQRVMQSHDRSKFEIYCYYNHYINDQLTEHLRKLSDHWLQCTSLNDEQLASRIQADEIDILVDLSGHTAGNRLPMFARKPAPVQVTWMGYCGTTGLSAMDYRFTEICLDPVGMSERYYTEKFVYLPSALAIFQSEPEAPEVNELPSLSGEGFTFACLNNPSKLNEQVIALWARILHAVPGSRLMLGNAVVVRDRLLELFARYGIGSERLLLQPRVGILDYLTLHHQIDLALDPFPYNGGTTTLHSLWMGVPVLTLAGDRTVSRVGASIMNGFGLSRFVAESEEAYFERAVEFSHNLAELDELRHGLRACIAENTTCDAAGYTRAVETAYKNMWQQWCEQRAVAMTKEEA